MGGGRKNFNNLRHLTLLLLRPWEILQQNYAEILKKERGPHGQSVIEGGKMCIWFPEVHSVPSRERKRLTWMWALKCKQAEVWVGRAHWNVALTCNLNRAFEVISLSSQLPHSKRKKGEGLKHVNKETQSTDYLPLLNSSDFLLTRACPCIVHMGTQRGHWPSSGKGWSFSGHLNQFYQSEKASLETAWNYVDNE